eukprot:GILI01008926.1.p1 GENE.GILI01008926.1~~GILI01008926.1.p1  ORF type:complete len:721 (-),score=190.13 GILI01008926.1:123-2285(-)
MSMARRTESVETGHMDYIDKVGSALLELFLEVKERSNRASAEELQRERDGLRGKDCMVLMDYLRVSVRVLLAFKEEQEKGLHDSVKKARNQQDESVTELQNRIKELQGMLSRKQVELEVCERRYREVDQKREHFEETKKEMIEQMRSDNQALRDITKLKDEEVQLLRVQLDEKDMHIRNLETLNQQIPALTAKLNELSKKYSKDFTKAHGQFQRQITTVNKEVARMAKLEATLLEKEEQIKKLQNERDSYRSQQARIRTDDLQGRVQKLQEQIQKSQENSSKQNMEISRLKAKLEKRDAELNKLQDQHNRLQADMQKYNRPLMGLDGADPSKGPSSSVPLEMQRVAAPQQVEFYRKKLDEKEKEYSAVVRKLRRLVQAEKKASLRDKNFELERMTYRQRLAQLEAAISQYDPFSRTRASASLSVLPQSSSTIDTSLFADDSGTSDDETFSGPSSPVSTYRKRLNSARLNPSASAASFASAASSVGGGLPASASSPSLLHNYTLASSVSSSNLGASQSATSLHNTSSSSSSPDHLLTASQITTREIFLQAQLQDSLQKQKTLEQQLQNMENVKAISISTANAYEDLMRKVKGHDDRSRPLRSRPSTAGTARDLGHSPSASSFFSAATSAHPTSASSSRTDLHTSGSTSFISSASTTSLHQTSISSSLTSPSSRPSSAASSRPMSASRARPLVGGSKPAIPVGALLGSGSSSRPTSAPPRRS